MAKITLENVEFNAKVYGWVAIKAPDMFASFRRKGARINIWKDKWGTLTVGTAIDHPTQGKTQLFRKHVSLEMLERIFNNPRVHTRLGYKQKTFTNSRRWA